MGLGSDSRDRVIVELGPEGRPGPGFCQVAGQAHIKVSWTGMVWQAENTINPITLAHGYRWDPGDNRRALGVS